MKEVFFEVVTPIVTAFLVVSLFVFLVFVVVEDASKGVVKEHENRMIECVVLIKHTPPENDRHIDALVWLAQHEACRLCPKEGE